MISGLFHLAVESDHVLNFIPYSNPIKPPEFFDDGLECCRNSVFRILFLRGTLHLLQVKWYSGSVWTEKKGAKESVGFVLEVWICVLTDHEGPITGKHDGTAI